MKKVVKTFGNLSIEMRKYKRVMGHDDSLPYNAELWVGKDHIANCFNDGWGGETVITPINTKLFNEVSKVVCATKTIIINKEFPYTMPMLADDLADEIEKNLLIEKYQKKGLVFHNGNDGSLKIIPFNSGKRKNIPIEEMLLTQSGQELIKKTIDKYTQMGLKLVSTNIRYSKVLK